MPLAPPSLSTTMSNFNENDGLPSLEECVNSIKSIGYDRHSHGSKQQAELFTSCVAFFSLLGLDRWVVYFSTGVVPPTGCLELSFAFITYRYSSLTVFLFLSLDRMIGNILRVQVGILYLQSMRYQQWVLY